MRSNVICIFGAEGMKDLKKRIGKKFRNSGGIELFTNLYSYANIPDHLMKEQYLIKRNSYLLFSVIICSLMIRFDIMKRF